MIEDVPSINATVAVRDLEQTSRVRVWAMLSKTVSSARLASRHLRSPKTRTQAEHCIPRFVTALCALGASHASATGFVYAIKLDLQLPRTFGAPRGRASPDVGQRHLPYWLRVIEISSTASRSSIMTWRSIGVHPVLCRAVHMAVSLLSCDSGHSAISIPSATYTTNTVNHDEGITA